MDQALFDKLTEKINKSRHDPKSALQRFEKFRSKFPPLLSGSHTRIFLSFACGEVELKKSIEELTRLKAPSKICGTLINPYDLMWRCDTCSFAPNGCFCLSCFDPNMHKGHKYSFSLGSTGTCDCGDACYFKAEAFCAVHKGSSFGEEEHVDEYLKDLPPYMQVAAPLVIQSFLSDLHQVLLELSFPIDKEKEVATSNIVNSLEALGVLMESHTGLLNLICNYLNKKIQKHYTVHKCIGSEETKLHICTCSTLHCIVRNLSKISPSANILISYKELAKKNVTFRKSFYEAYFAFYEELAINDKLIQTLEDIPFQAVGHKEFVQDVLRKYIVNYLKVAKRSVEIFAKDEKKETVPLYSLYSTFLSLMMWYSKNNMLLIEELNFYEEFLVSICELQAADCKYGDSNVRGEYFLTSIFAYGHIGYRFTLPLHSSVKSILKRFKALIEEDFHRNQEIYNGTAKEDLFFMDNILYRIFGSYLNKLIIDLLPQENNDMKKVRARIQEAMEMESISNMDKLIAKALIPSMKALVNACRYTSGSYKPLKEEQAETLRIYYEKIASTWMQDITTVQVCMSLLTDSGFMNKLLFNWMFTARKEEQPKYIEGLNYLLGLMLFNTQSRKCLYVNWSIRFTNREVLSSDKELYENILEGEVMQGLIQEKYESEMFKCILLNKLINTLNFDVRASNIEDTLTKMLCVNTASTGYTLSERNLREIRMFNHANVANLHSFIENYRNILSHLKIDIGSYNVLENKQSQIHVFSLVKDEILAKIDDKQVIAFAFQTITSKDDKYSGDFTKLSVIQILYELLTISKNLKELIKKEVNADKIVEALKDIAAKKDLYACGINELLKVFELEQVSNVTSEKDAAELAKEEKKKKKADILKQFEAKRKKFSEAHKGDIIESEKSYEETKIICGLCRESIDPSKEEEQPYGQMCFISQINIFGYVLRQEIEKISYQWHLKSPCQKALFDDEVIFLITRSGMAMNACGHHMHLDCSRKYKEELQKEHKSFNCPVCKVKASMIVPVVNGNQGLDLQTTLQMCDIFRRLLSISSDEHISYDKIKELYKILGTAFIYLIQSEKIMGVESLFNKHGEVIGNLLKLLNLCLSPYSRKLITESVILPFEEEEIPTNIFAVDCLSKMLAELLVPKPIGKQRKVDNENLRKTLNIIYCQSMLKQALMVLSKDKVDIVSSREVLIKTLVYCREKCQKEILQDCVDFIEKYALAFAIMENWEKEKREEAIKIFSNDKDLHEKVIDFSSLLGLGNEIDEMLKGLVNSNIDLNYIDKELSKYQMSCERIYEKYKGKIEDSKNIYISFMLHAKVSMKVSPLSFNLINLPEDYENVLLRYAGINCEVCSKNSPRKCVCLICGTIACYNSECCKNVELIAHAVYCNMGRGVFLNVYHGNLILVSGMRSIEDDTGLYKDILGCDVGEYLKLGWEKHSAKLAQYKLVKQRYEQLREIIAQGQELQALDSAAAKNPEACPIF